MRVLITGGLGYIGGRFAQFLNSRGGHEILLGSRQQVESLDWLHNVKIAQTRWNSEVSLEKICMGVDAIVHSAGMNAQECREDPVAALEFNGVATARLLNAAISQGVKRFIYLSTAHVYGNILEGVITEETCPTNRHPYATSHRAGEDVVLSAHQIGEIEGIVIRLSNAYGSPAHKDANCWMLVVNDLCRQMVATKKMVLRSDGLQKRNFVPLTEVCRAIEHLLALPKQDIGSSIFNVGGKSVSVWEIACFIRERGKAVLKFMPELSRVEQEEHHAISELDYRIDALLKSGFWENSEPGLEIDQLIEFCRLSFS